MALQRVKWGKWLTSYFAGHHLKWLFNDILTCLIFRGGGECMCRKHYNMYLVAKLDYLWCWRLDFCIAHVSPLSIKTWRSIVLCNSCTVKNFLTWNFCLLFTLKRRASDGLGRLRHMIIVALIFCVSCIFALGALQHLCIVIGHYCLHIYFQRALLPTYIVMFCLCLFSLFAAWVL